MQPIRRSSKLAALLALVLSGGFLTVAAPVAQSAPTADDTPVLLTPKGEHESGDDEESFDKLRDAYYWSRLLAGDDQLSLGEAAKLRSTASTRAASITNEKTRGADRGGTWTTQGPNPIVQVGRTTNTFQAVSGRIGALAIRKDGTIILGAAQGGVWTYDATAGTWTSRTNDSDTQSVGALAIAPSNDRVVYMGSGEGALSGDSYYGDGIYRSKRRRPDLEARVAAVHRPGGHRHRGRPAATPTTCTSPRSAVAAATTARPPRPTSSTGSGSRPTAARAGTCARAPRTRSTARPTW